ncbi:MAG: DUF2085 domain-containing protein [Theionarchaea archaeon]|nr:DUF2085 domain-containing protein [Theionarchaea archaeon]
MNYKRAYLLLILGETLWFLSIVITPLLTAADLRAPAHFLYYFYSHFCHQIPERSLFLWGEQLPVCARDVAVYAALIPATVLYPLLRPLHTSKLPSKWYLIIFLFPIALDGGTQLIGLRESTNLLRILTGSIAGSIVPFYLIPLMMASTSIDIEECHSNNREDIYKESERPTHEGKKTHHDFDQEKQEQNH